jgi:uncharacterized protein (DUF427 family)
MSQRIQEQNKALVLEAFDTLFNKRDYAAAEKYWSPNYIQHSARVSTLISLSCKKTDHATYCPYKGDCNYYSVPAGGEKSVNAVWTYENPYPAVAQIKEHVAFYPDRVDEIAEQLPTARESLKSSRA